MAHGAIDKVYFGWDGPVLEAAVRWLADHDPPATVWDLSELTIVLPVSRALRRLRELLLDVAGRNAVVMPRLLTIGRLPSLLMQPPQRVAGELECLLHWAAVLRSATPAQRESVFPHVPDADNAVAWLGLARQVKQLQDTLAAAAVRMADVNPRCADRAEFTELECRRWTELGELQQRYEAQLDAAGCIDEQLARIDAVNHDACRLDQPIILLACNDLPTIVQQMIRQAAATDNITALLPLPAEAAASVNDVGCVDAAQWQQQHLPIDDAQLCVVDRPADQAYATLRVMNATVTPEHAPDDVTVGLADPRLEPTLQRTLELADVPVRSAVPRDLSRAGPTLLLHAVAEFLAEARLDRFAALLRHADLEGFVHAHTDAAGHAVRDWLTLLDDYATDTLQQHVTGQWLDAGTPRAAQLKQVFDAVMTLLPHEANLEHAANDRQPLTAWVQPIADLLAAVYGDLTFDSDDHDEAAAVRRASLQSLGDTLRTINELDLPAPLTPDTTFPQALRIVAALAGRQTTSPPHTGPAVELLGYLELALDDAPLLVLTGMNEGAAPSSINADAFLPNRLRSLLGLPDNDHRFARDAFLLNLMLRTREHVTLIAGRRDHDDNPMPPSRLLLQCDADTLAARVARFYAEDHAEPPPPALLPAGGNAFLLPMPQPLREPIDQLHVTAFRRYLACPYRFYLQHVESLKAVDDRAVELEAFAFGNLAHEVFKAFGKQGPITSNDPKRIYQDFEARLHDIVARMHGSRLRAAVTIQIEQLLQRLEAFAQVQAHAVDDGWRLLPEKMEEKLAVTIDVDGEPFTINGRVDRIERHDQLGYRIADYKTGDRARKPRQTHQQTVDGQLQWLDLQLPLYRTFAQGIGIEPGAPLALGYINLPKKLDDVGWQEADWNDAELADADDTRDHVIRAIRREIFWPPAAPPTWPDDLTAIAGDEVIDRADMIRRQTQARAAAGTETLP